MLTVIDMVIYHHHIFATGALQVSSIRSMSASLVRAALADAPNASASFSSQRSSGTTVLRFRPRFSPDSPSFAWVVPYGRPRFALPAAFLASSRLARSAHSAQIASRSSCFIARPSPFLPGFFRISDLVFRRVLTSLLAALRCPM